MITMLHLGYFKDLFYGFSIQAGDQKIVLAASSPEGRWDWKRTLLSHGAVIKEDIMKEGFLEMKLAVRSTPKAISAKRAESAESH
jgi:hypothetical protein